MSCIITYNGQNFTQEDFLDYLKTPVISINNPDAMHILDSKKDVEGFKNWVDEFNRGTYLPLASELVNPAI